MWWNTCSWSIWNNISDMHSFHHFLLHPCIHKMKLHALLDLCFILHSFTSSPWFQVLHTVCQYLHIWKMKFQHHLWDLALTDFHLYLISQFKFPLQNVTYCKWTFNPYPTAFPYGNGMVLHFYQQQESSTTKTVRKVINKGLKTYV